MGSDGLGALLKRWVSIEFLVGKSNPCDEVRIRLVRRHGFKAELSSDGDDIILVDSVTADPKSADECRTRLVKS